MKMMKLGFMALLVLGLAACSGQKPEVTELTKDQIQSDVVSQLSEAYAGASIEDFAVASNTELKTIKTVLGTMTVKTAVSSLNGEYINTYELVDQAWVLKSTLFTPKTYTWVDPSTYPDQARLEEDLKKLDLTYPIDQIEKIEYTIVQGFDYTTNKASESNIVFQITITYRSSIGTVTSQIDLGYLFLEQVWTSGKGNVMSTSITDFTQRPDPQDMLEWSVMPFNEGDSNIQFRPDESHLTSSSFDEKIGILTEKYHIDKWVFSHLRYEADITVIGLYNLELGDWEITCQYVDLKQTLDMNIKERFVWETMSSSESVYTKGESIDLDLVGSMTIKTPAEMTWTLDVSGTLRINGVLKTFSAKPIQLAMVEDRAVEVSYGPGSKDKFILCYSWNEKAKEVNWILLSPDQSEAYLVP